MGTDGGNYSVAFDGISPKNVIQIQHCHTQFNVALIQLFSPFPPSPLFSDPLSYYNISRSTLLRHPLSYCNLTQPLIKQTVPPFNWRSSTNWNKWLDFLLFFLFTFPVAVVTSLRQTNAQMINASVVSCVVDSAFDPSQSTPV